MSVTTRGSAARDKHPESDFVFPAQFAWHESAPPAVADPAAWQADLAGWKGWKKHLAGRRRPRPLARLLHSERPLAWCLPKDDGAWRSLRKLLKSLPGKRGQAVDSGPWQENLSAWLAADPLEHLDLTSALSALAWCHALPALAEQVPPQLWWEALARLVELAAEPTGLDTALPPLVWQLAAAELPLTLAYLFPEIATCRRLAGQGRQALAAGMEELLDGDGLPRFQHFGSLLPLLACWTRVRAMSEETPNGEWSDSAARQYAEMVRHAMRLARVDASLMLVDQELDSQYLEKDLLRAAARLSGNGRLERFARQWQTEVGKSPGRWHVKPDGWSGKRSKPGTHSEWSQFALLRRDWSPASPRLAIGYSGRTLVCEAAAGRHVLLAGNCQPQVRSAGRLLEPVSGWEEVCWVSDADGDYVELEMTLENSVRIQRQMYLARRDLFLFSADAILSAEVLPIEYSVSFGLGPGLSLRAADETREAWLVAKKPQATVMPLALSEWQSDPRGGRLSVVDGQLNLAQSAPACRGLFAPLFFDLNRSRIGLPLTWRQLTVAENRVIQSSDAAVGYRVQIGRQNWLIYRSLTGPANRTLLGHHLLTQFLIGQFTSAGEVQTLVDIE
jgi:hypothetical protein